jgi:hypothetical protein
MAGLRKAQINGCINKNRYSTRELAEAARLGAETERRVALRVYQCEFCCGFHLTKKPINRNRLTTLQPSVQLVTFNDRGQTIRRG